MCVYIDHLHKALLLPIDAELNLSSLFTDGIAFGQQVTCTPNFYGPYDVVLSCSAGYVRECLQMTKYYELFAVIFWSKGERS